MLQGVPFIVSTHHRCGIVLMRNVFEEVCAAPGLSFCKAPGRDRVVPELWQQHRYGAVLLGEEA